MNSSSVEALFALALAKPAEKRAAFLDAMCDGDAALRARLDALLAAHEQPASELAGADASTVKADEGIHKLDEAWAKRWGATSCWSKSGRADAAWSISAERRESKFLSSPIVFAAIFTFAVWGDTLSALAWAGMVVIVASGLVAMGVEKKAQLKEAGRES